MIDLKKIVYIILAIILILVLAAIGVYFWLASSTTTTAYLNIEQGKVQVNKGKGWVDAVDEMELGLNDKIKTLSDGQASIVMYESTIISLDPDTEVSLADIDKEHLKIKQDSGTTWNKFTGLLGVEGLSVETPNTVATVRGTSFEVSLDSIMVGEGVVDVTFDGEKVTLNEDEKVELEDVMDEKTGKRIKRFVKKKLSDIDRERLLKKFERTIKILRNVRIREVNKKKIVVDRLKSKYEVTDRDIKEKLEEADRGQYDLEEVERKAPVKMEAVTRVKHLTEKIIGQNEAMKRLKERLNTLESVGNVTPPLRERNNLITGQAAGEIQRPAQRLTIKEPVQPVIR